MKNIFIGGAAGSGKDTVCNMIIEQVPGYSRYGFADPLKVIVDSFFGWSSEHRDGKLKEVMVDLTFNVNEQKENIDKFVETFNSYFQGKYNVDPMKLLAEYSHDLMVNGVHFENHKWGFNINNISPRLSYQVFGTETCRNRIDKNIWVDIAPKENVIVPDMRFKNEYDFAKSIGAICLMIDKEKVKQVLSHESETLYKTFDYDYVIDNNGTIEELEEKVNDFILTLGV